MDLLALRQADGETVKSFFARIKGKAATCAYSIGCPGPACARVVDFTNVIVKDVLISGLCDEEIKIEVFGWHDLDQNQFIETKEMARNALTRTPTMSAISSYKKAGKPSCTTADTTTRVCKSCTTRIEKSVWSRRQKKMIERNFCSHCWSKQVRGRQKPNNIEAAEKNRGETGAIAVGSIQSASTKPLNHLIFDTDNGWERAESLEHPLLTLTASVDEREYTEINHNPPSVNSFNVSVITDTGAQSCLRAEFSKSDLILVKHSLYAANKGGNSPTTLGNRN
jgi:hypothetical protein